MSNTLEQVEIAGQLIWVEVSEVKLAPAGSPAPSSGKFRDTDAGGSAAAIVGTITKVDIAATLAAVVGQAKSALDKFAPSEVNLEISLGFKAGVGAFVASGEANAQVKISAKWKNEAAKEKPEAAKDAPSDPH